MKLTPNTAISLSLAITLGGGIVWFVRVDAQVQQNKYDIERQKQMSREILDKLNIIREDVSYIKGKLERQK